MAINHYQGAIKHAETAEELGRLLQDADWAKERWARLVDGDCTFHDHDKTKVSHQVWTHPESGVDCQKYLGYY